MDEDLRKSLIEGVEDIVTPEAKKRADFLKSVTCPTCGCDFCLATIDPDRPFTQAEMMPRQLMICQDCGAVFEPYTKIQVNQQQIPKSVIETSEMFIKSS